MTAGKTPSDDMVQALFERLAHAAAREIMTCQQAGVDVQKKDDNMPVTEADMRAEAVILAGLENELPKVPHVGEEEVSSGTVPGDLGDCFVLIDPLDGTREFIAGRSEFTVNIALIRRGVPVVGVVMAPATGVVYSARPGVAERFEVRVDGSKGERERIFATKKGVTVRIVASRSHGLRSSSCLYLRSAAGRIRGDLDSPGSSFVLSSASLTWPRA